MNSKEKEKEEEHKGKKGKHERAQEKKQEKDSTEKTGGDEKAVANKKDAKNGAKEKGQDRKKDKEETENKKKEAPIKFIPAQAEKISPIFSLPSTPPSKQKAEAKLADLAAHLEEMGTDDGEDELELDLLQSGKLEQVSLCDGKAPAKGSNDENTDEETDEERDEEKDEEDSEGEGEPESGEEGSEEEDEEGDEEGEYDADSDEESDAEEVEQGPPGEIDDVDPSTSESDDGSDEESNGEVETEGEVEKEKSEKEETTTNPPDAANQHALVAVTQDTNTQAVVLRNSTLIKIMYGWQGLGSLLSIFKGSPNTTKKTKKYIHP